MAVREIELRVAALEAEVTRLKTQMQEASKPEQDWLDRWYGAFANDPLFDEAMSLGRKYRESLRPKRARTSAREATKRAVGKSGKARQT